ncbi:unnamed protein product [Leptosia nina]|uniref:Uncharacterized protein n=1 Tax=Leptosia nina TaxID=320188 RepID=A0AAV1JSF7_9NEOP
MKKSHKSKPLFSIQCYEDRQHTLRLRKLSEDSTDHDNTIQERLHSTEKPPPPPPMPVTNGHNKADVLNGEQKPKKEDTNIINTPDYKKNGALLRTPTPDYNNKEFPIKSKSLNEANAEVDSLESYKLQNPANVPPKPPSNYFLKAPNGTATMKKHSRPVSVTIGEYVNHMNGRREPSKLEFLNGDKKNGSQLLDDESITSRLQSELALTLSRSNLRKKTETMADGGR